MKYKFKSSNYVVRVRKNSKVGEVIKNNKDDESKIARAIIESLEDKTKKLENTRDLFINLMAWGLLLSVTKAVGKRNKQDILDKIFYFINGVTGICALIGISTHAVIKGMEKKKDKIYEIYRKVDNKPNKEFTINEIRKRKI